ncbi:MAG TPA: crotonase/enoyl-CoA hydratase family protein [Rhodocyclaceae bacterium]|nr:crotonase/enoyl-CoA hydratase family protein [Rhodocyclaceae bacterium]
MSATAAEALQIERHGHCLTMRFNRPEKMNAFSPEMYHRLAQAYYLLEHDGELRCGLLCAAGPNFTSGLELDKWAPIFAAGHMPTLNEGELDPFGLTGPRLSKPIVMAAQGYCYTVGMELMLNTDLRVVTEDIKLAQIEVKRGIYPCGGATIRLQEEIGWANAQRYLMTGDTITAAEAYRMGLVQAVVDAEQLMPTAEAWLQKIVAAAPLGVQASLRSSRHARLHGERAATETLFDDMISVMQSEDAKEGVASFMERRAARFVGR